MVLSLPAHYAAAWADPVAADTKSQGREAGARECPTSQSDGRAMKRFPLAEVTLLLGVTTVVYFHLHPLVLLGFAIWALVRAWIWLSWRFPLSMYFINRLILGLLGGRGRRW